MSATLVPYRVIAADGSCTQVTAAVTFNAAGIVSAPIAWLNGTTVSTVAPTIPAGGKLEPGDCCNTKFRSTAVNRLVNGCFRFWQRGVTSGALALGWTYYADRWAATASGQSGRSFSKQVGSLPSKTAWRFGRDAGNTNVQAVGLIQAMESVEASALAGRTVTVIYRARAGANYAGTFTPTVATGEGVDQALPFFSAWTNEATPYSTPQAITTAWNTYRFTCTISPTATQVRLMFNVSFAGTAGANDWVELEEVGMYDGDIVTAFAPAPYSDELRRCKRFWQRIKTPVGVGVMTSTTNASRITRALDTPMRVAPAVTLTGGSVSLSDGSATTTSSTIAANATTVDTLNVDLTAAAALTSTRPVVVYDGGGGGRFDLNSEIA